MDLGISALNYLLPLPLPPSPLSPSLPVPSSTFPSFALVASSYTGTHSCSVFTSVMATTYPKTLSRVFLSILWLLHCFCPFF